ncbi:Iwr1 protein [Saccharomycopsis crataegensis]|uniref:Iwr1 protein n=1 Tax=Saccharomycopsis crataegensis TaxID=43959 RepID=A0AAV5QJD0_9ASCO|nr:Iwr1 protein [Saccharomycopsis crataegensis]
MQKKKVPEVVRIKRRVSDDPLQALILESHRQLKRSKSSTYLFKLTRTDSDSNKSVSENGSLLQRYPRGVSTNAKSSSTAYGNDDQRTFVLQSMSTQEEIPDVLDQDVQGEVPPELVDMVSEYLQSEGKSENKSTIAPKRIKRPGHSSALRNEIKNDDNDDEKGFVYDVYYRDKAIYDESEKSGISIGIIKFADEDLELLTDDEDDNSDLARLSDDEDSNAEDFYRNDYPENEDDDKGIVIGNEDQWYSDDEDYYKQFDNEDDNDLDSLEERMARHKITYNLEEDDEADDEEEGEEKEEEYDETVIDRLRKEHKEFGELSMNEVDYLYHEFYENGNSLIDED